MNNNPELNDGAGQPVRCSAWLGGSVMEKTRLRERIRIGDVVLNGVVENRVEQLAVSDGALRACNRQIASIKGVHVPRHVNHHGLPFSVAPLCVINVGRTMHLDKVSLDVGVQLIGASPRP